MRIPRSFLASAMLMAAGMVSSRQPYIHYDSGKRDHNPGQFKDNTLLRQFTVKGVVIKARNKKTAEKIYRLHHAKKANNG